ncbi:MAG: HAMP domain-containing sensor histidine kinase [Chitinophagales bacterium]
MNALIERYQKFIFPALIALLVLLATVTHTGTTLPEAQVKLETQLVAMRTAFNHGLQQLTANQFPAAGAVQWQVYNRSDSLIYYTTNDVDAPAISGLPSGDSLMHLKNGWYYVQKQTVGTFDVAALALIKNDYPFENKFLRNAFPPCFKIPAQYTISEFALKGALPVRNIEGRQLFWLYADETRVERQSSPVMVLVYSLLLFFLCYYVNFFAGEVARRFGNLSGIFVLLLAVVNLRIAMIIFKFPSAIYELDIFDSSYYATAFFAQSLGDLVITCIMFFWLVSFYFARSKAHHFFTAPYRWPLAEKIYLLTLQYVAAGIIIWLMKSMVLDSTISFEVYNVLSLTPYSIIGMACLGLILTSHFLFTVKALRRLRDMGTSIQTIFWGTLLLGVPFYLLLMPIGFGEIVCFTVIWCCLFGVSGFVLFKDDDQIRAPEKVIVFIIFYSVFSMFLIENLYEKKERQHREFFAGKLASGHDYIAEFSYREIATRIVNDRYIKSYFNNPLAAPRDLRDRIVSLYFSGYFNKYDIHVSAFNAKGEPIHIADSTQLAQGAITTQPADTLIYLTDSAGNNCYISNLSIKQEGQLIGTLALKFSPKLYNGQSVYPELLLNKNMSSANSVDYNFAIYQRDRLVVQHGDYPYSYYWDHHFNTPRGEHLGFLETNDWEHLVCYYPNDRKVIVSIPQEGFFEPVAATSYFFVLYFIVISVLITIYNVEERVRTRAFTDGIQLSFRTRINSAMLLIIAISFVIIGFVTISFFTRQYDSFYTDRLVRKEKAILADVEYFIQENAEAANKLSLTRNSIEDLLNVELAKLSQIHNIDINIFDKKGELAISSQPEIFENGLVSRRMHPAALYELGVQNETQYTQQENIGGLSYTATYAPVRNGNGQTLAYLSVPYFEKSKTIRDEVSSFLVALMNAYVFLLLCAAALAYFISNSITRPLRFISEKFRLLNLTRRNEPIEWNSRDELGTLITEYNKMIAQLELSAQQLAKSERESAWREMARQIAHEIKNPLTPMKLSIQYLQRAIDENNPNVPEMARKVNKTLIEQIENLSTIATAFSSFAQMPRSNNEVINLNELLAGLIVLFDKETVQLTFEATFDPAMVYADKSQLLSVFTNLVKNAIQSIPEEREGKVRIHTSIENKIIRTVVTDNGCGIPRSAFEKVFQPNFTTKSSGTGLGLAIARQIIEGANGKIWFETVEGVGTSFFVELPEQVSGESEN